MVVLHQEPSERDDEYRDTEDDAESGAVEMGWLRHPEFGIDRLNVFACRRPSTRRSPSSSVTGKSRDWRGAGGTDLAGAGDRLAPLPRYARK